MPSTSPKAARVERMSNWVGFVCYALLALRIVIQTPQIGLWMLPSFLHESIIGVSFLIRRPSRRTAAGLIPRAAAYVGTFIVPAFLTAAGTWRPRWIDLSPSLELQKAGLVLWLMGSFTGLWTLWTLRRSFSLVPQARALVTSGPYRLARHPIYGGYVLQYVGLWLAHFTLIFGAVLLVWVVITFGRMHFEEQVLEKEFPEYSDYRQKVGIFAPRLHGSRDKSKSVTSNVY